MGRAKWRFFEAESDLRLPNFLCAAPDRMVEGAPSSESLQGSLYGEGFVYQYAARSSALALLLVSVWLAPTVGYGNRVIISEVIARAIGARRRVIGSGPSDKWEVEKYENDGKPWSSNAVLDNVVGAIVCRIVVSQTSGKVGMLQIRLAGAAPNVGGRHLRFRRIVSRSPRARVASW